MDPERPPGAAQSATGGASRSARSALRPWLWSLGLILLGLVPVFARLLVELAGSQGATSGNVHFGASPPAFVHAVSGSMFVVLGAVQFSMALRRRRGWHRRVGRLLVPVGLIVALSAVWLTLFSPQTADSGGLLVLFRLLFSSAMAASIVAGFTAIQRRDVARHRAWMIRAYAIGLGAGTQVFTLGFGDAVFGTGELSTALLKLTGWVINLAVAKWVIRHRSRRRASRTASQLGGGLDERYTAAERPDVAVRAAPKPTPR